MAQNNRWLLVVGWIPQGQAVAVILLNPLLQSLLLKCLYVITSVLQKGKVRKQ